MEGHGVQGQATEKIWVRQGLAPADLPHFCQTLSKALGDKGMRLKLYLDGPKQTYKWTMSVLSNSALVCALILASTFGSIFNADLYNFAEQTGSQSDRFLAYASSFSLFLGIISSAAGIGISTVLLNTLPQMVRQSSADMIAYLALYSGRIMVAAFIAPFIAVCLALLSLHIWVFIVYHNGFGITLACVTVVGLVWFSLTFSTMLSSMFRRCDAFEKIVLASGSNFDEAFKALTNFPLKEEGQRILGKIRLGAWESDDD